MVDWINCTATLDRDLRAMAQNFGLDFRAGAPQRQGPGKDYRSYCSDALPDLVARNRQREIELFGFGFDLPQSKFTPIELADRVRGASKVRLARRSAPPRRGYRGKPGESALVRGICLNPSATMA